MHSHGVVSVQLSFRSTSKEIKPLQNKKGQKNLGYPRKKQSFYKEKDCFFSGTPKFFGPSYFEVALEVFFFVGCMVSWPNRLFQD